MALLFELLELRWRNRRDERVPILVQKVARAGVFLAKKVQNHAKCERGCVARQKTGRKGLKVPRMSGAPCA